MDAPLSLASASDQIVAGRAADGDVQAFEVLVRRYSPLLRAYAFRILRTSTDVDDVVQDSFVTAWRQLGKLENPAAVKGWLIKIATRRSLDLVRSRRDHDDVSDHDIEADPARTPLAVAETKSRNDALRRALDSLPADQQRCWVLREIAEYSYDDISKELGIPASTVRGLLSRARKNLVHGMEEWR